jgi:CRP-like cAMP-binding protein
MKQAILEPGRLRPAIRRLSALAPLDEDAHLALGLAIRKSRTVAPRRELLVEGAEIKERLLILNGWAARFRQLEDGRKQIVSLLLPGDLVGLCDQEQPLATASITAITSLEVCAVPDRTASHALARAYALSRALDDAYLTAQVVRLGRMNAYERIADLMLELLERMELAGLAQTGRYHLPLTQEALADMLGLTSVHVNRTLQAMRRTGEVSWKGRDLSIASPSSLYRQIGRARPRISATQPF